MRTLLARREDDPHLARGMALLLCLLVRDGDGGQLFDTYEHVSHLVHLLSTLPPPVVSDGSGAVKLKAPVMRSIARLDAACTTCLRVAGAVLPFRPCPSCLGLERPYTGHRRLDQKLTASESPRFGVSSVNRLGVGGWVF